jgi:hypothetical protein
MTQKSLALAGRESAYTLPTLGTRSPRRSDRPDSRPSGTSRKRSLASQMKPVIVMPIKLQETNLASVYGRARRQS